MDTKNIRITNLYINIDNPRFELQSSQKEAMDRIIEDQQDKLVVLATDIIEHGLNPMDMILVTPVSETQYTVLEGNRRVTALKLLFNPLLIDERFHGLRKKFIKLSQKKDISFLKSVRCLIEEDETQANIWIKRKHAGELDGKGTVRWNSLQIQRFDAKNDGKASDVLQIIEFLNDSKYVSVNLKKEMSYLNTTNLARLIADPDVRNYLGLLKDKGVFWTAYSYEVIARRLVLVIEKILSPDFTVKQIYNKERRKEFVESLDFKSQQEDPSDTIKVLNEHVEVASGKIAKNVKKKEDTNVRPQRASLIPSKLNLPIENVRIYQVFDELKHLSMRQYPNAVAVLYRVFLELSVDSFIDSHQLTKNTETASQEKNLIGKCWKVVEYIRQNKLLADDQIKGIQHEIKDPNSVISIDTLNAFVHNRHFSPKDDNLRIGWDNIQPFFEAMWNNMSKNN